MRNLANWLGACLLGGLASCGDAEPARAAVKVPDVRTQPVLLTGSSTMGPLLSAAAAQYEAENPGTRIDVQTGGSTRGIADARRGLADIGMTSRLLEPAENAGLREYILATDGVGFVVHAENPVDGLTGSQLLNIFTGTVSDWFDVGGEAGEIVVVNRPDGRSELSLVSDYFRIPPERMTADAIAGENTQVLKMIEGNRQAIAFVSIGSAAHSITSGSMAKLLELDGVPATAAHVKDGTYLLSRPLVLVTGTDIHAEAQAFLDYLLSGQVDELILNLSFVPPAREQR